MLIFNWLCIRKGSIWSNVWYLFKIQPFWPPGLDLASRLICRSVGFIKVWETIPEYSWNQHQNCDNYACFSLNIFWKTSKTTNFLPTKFAGMATLLTFESRYYISYIFIIHMYHMIWKTLKLSTFEMFAHVKTSNIP
jgi:hypothetical protein